MRLLFIVVTLLAGAALADIGPRPPKCSVPEGCVTCDSHGTTPNEECVGAALDAGLVLSECSDRRGAVFSHYYCPPGKKASRGCGCATTDVLALSALGVLVPMLRRRRR